MIASELFGHERGAFTGAVRATKGGAAELPELSPLPLYSKMRKLGIKKHLFFSERPIAVK